MHPAFKPACLISLWMACSLWLNGQPFNLGWGGFFLGMTALGAWRHVWRLRFLWLGFFVGFAWSVPGDLVWPSPLSPSWQGMSHAFGQSLKVLSMMGLARWVMHRVSERTLVSGFFAFFQGILTVPMAHAWVQSLWWLRSLPTLDWRGCMDLLDREAPFVDKASFELTGLPWGQRLWVYLLGGWVLWMLNVLF